jgi:ankyrin
MESSSVFDSTALHDAVKQEDLKLVESLLASGADPNSLDQDGFAPLENAIWQGCLPLVNLLLEKGADLNKMSSLNFSCLHFAVMKNYVEIAALLIKKGVNLNARANINALNYTPLDLATKLDRVELVQLLLANGANPTVSEEGFRTFYWAAEKGHLNIVNLLLANYPEFINKMDQDGCTLLSLAAQHGHVDIARLLLEKGADPNMHTENGFTPLHWAADNGKLELVNLLLERGASLNDAANQDSFTPLHLAVDQNYVEVSRLLLEKGADPNIAAENGTTPLHWAAYNGHIEQINLLIEKGANINVIDYAGWTPLHIASKQVNISSSEVYLDVILSLLSYKPDLNLENKRGESFLHILADDPDIHSLQEALRCIEAMQHVSLNQLLGVMEDCCPELTNNDTKRILAIIVDYVEGLDVSLKNHENNTALDILQQLELDKEADQLLCEEMVKALQRHQRLGGWLSLPRQKRDSSQSAISNEDVTYESALKKPRYQ